MRKKKKTNFSLFKWLLHNFLLRKLMIRGKALAKILPFQLELLFHSNQTAPRDDGKLYFSQEAEELEKHHFTNLDDHRSRGKS